MVPAALARKRKSNITCHDGLHGYSQFKEGGDDMAVKDKNIRAKRIVKAHGRSYSISTGTFVLKSVVGRTTEIATLPPGAPRTQTEAQARIEARVRANQDALNALAKL